MALQQISVFLENKYGRLAEVTRCLGNAGVSIRAITITDTMEFGILRIMVDNIDKAVKALTEGKYTFKLATILAVEVPDRPGGLADVMEIFRDEHVNIEYLYASLEKNKDAAVVIFKPKDLDHSIEIVRSHGLSITETL